MDWTLGAMAELAAFIQQQVKERGWTERYFEDVTGISKTALRSIVQGETKIPKLENLARLAKALETPLSYLVELCGYDLDEAVKLTEEERAVLAKLTPEQRARLIRRARDELGPNGK